MTYHELAKEIWEKSLSKARLAEVAVYKPGKTWTDFFYACKKGKENGTGMMLVADRLLCIEFAIKEVVTMK